jgi:hypothetical protein
MKGALPADLISAKQFPKVFAWIDRFSRAVADAKAKAPKVTSLKGDAAAKRVLGAKFVGPEPQVNASDPLKLSKDQLVEVWPTDSGFRHRDRGALIGLDNEEVVLAAESGVRLHFPRVGFRVAAVAEQSKL